ncbi:MAG: hypothetical protein ACYCYP_12460 [Leptospirales bacterium]
MSVRRPRARDPLLPAHLLLRFTRLFQVLDIARSTGKLLGFFKNLAKQDLLVPEDFGLSSLTSEHRQDRRPHAGRRHS